MNLHNSVKILQLCNVSPPPNSVPTTTIPLTFLDIPWILAHSAAEIILFYDFPHPTFHFTQEVLPQLKQSLSLTLQHFFPIAGSLVFPPSPAIPYIMYQNGDSIPLTVAESNNDFHNISKNSPRDAGEFRPLVPHLSHETSLSSSDAYEVPLQAIRPLLAVQVTLFPNRGISICITFCHVLGDARTINNFIKSWASIFKSKNDLSLLQPIQDRDTIAMIKDLNESLPILWKKIEVTWDDFATKVTAVAAATVQDRLHATFVLGRYEIDKLRHWLTSQFKNIVNEPPPLSHISTFVVTCAFIWVCLIKTKNVVTIPSIDSASSEDSCFHHFVFLADCTYRTESYVPQTYFGNCLLFCDASVRKNELLGENGLLMAAKAIMKEVKELDNGMLRNAERWLLLREGLEKIKPGHVVRVASSPKLRIYETDFGWGRLRKSEVVHIDKENGVLLLTESRDEEGGVEIGLSLDKVDMDAFISIFKLALQEKGALATNSLPAHKISSL